jgi:hypothetical protein
MADRVFLHIGAMKSGTSFIQNTLFANKAQLAGRGFLVAGEIWRSQVIAVGDVLGHKRVVKGARSDSWESLTKEINSWRGDAIISMEFLGPAGPRKIHTIVESFPKKDVEIVITGRDLNRSIPSMWQESLKNTGVADWTEYLDGVRSGIGPGKQFWREQDLAAMAQSWVDVVGPEHVTLITVPHPGAETGLLWSRFCAVVGIAPEGLTSIQAVNESLGAESALVLLEVNRLLTPAEFTWPEYAGLVKHGLAKSVLAGRRKEESPIGLVTEDWVAERSEQIAEKLAGLGLRIVGDLSELAPVDVPGVDPRTISSEARLAAAIEGLAGYVVWQRNRNKKPGGKRRRRWRR